MELKKVEKTHPIFPEYIQQGNNFLSYLRLKDDSDIWYETIYRYTHLGIENETQQKKAEIKFLNSGIDNLKNLNIVVSLWLPERGEYLYTLSEKQDLTVLEIINRMIDRSSFKLKLHPEVKIFLEDYSKTNENDDFIFYIQNKSVFIKRKIDRSYGVINHDEYLRLSKIK